MVAANTEDETFALPGVPVKRPTNLTLRRMVCQTFLVPFSVMTVWAFFLLIKNQLEKEFPSGREHGFSVSVVINRANLLIFVWVCQIPFPYPLWLMPFSHFSIFGYGYVRFFFFPLHVFGVQIIDLIFSPSPFTEIV